MRSASPSLGGGKADARAGLWTGVGGESAPQGWSVQALGAVLLFHPGPGILDSTLNITKEGACWGEG